MLLELFVKRLSNVFISPFSFFLFPSSIWKLTINVLYFSKLFQSSELTETLTSHYNDIDFDSQSDYRIFDQSLRSKIIEVIKSVSVMQPIEVFSWMVNRIQVTFDVKPSNEDLDGKQIFE